MKRVILWHSALLGTMLLTGCAEHAPVAEAQRGPSAAQRGAAARATFEDGGEANAPDAYFDEGGAAPDDLSMPVEAQAPSVEPAPLPAAGGPGAGGAGGAGYRSAGPAAAKSASASAPMGTTNPPPSPVRSPATSAPGGAAYASDPVARAEGGEAPPSPRPESRRPEPRKPRNDIQSNLLTAGSFDDNEHFDAYYKYLSKVLQQDRSEKFPRFALGERVEIQVVDPQGRPLGGARVVVRPGEQDESDELLSVVTPSDGRAVFCTGLDRAAGRQEFAVSVTLEGKQRATQTCKLDQRPWRITLADTEAALPKRLDLALVIDTTGSMADELEYLKAEIDGIATSVSQMFPNVDQRYALIVYRDQGDDYVSRTFDFTPSLQEFRNHLAAQSANGGGDKPEAVQLAVEHADKLSWRDGNVARVMFLVGDAPPHDEYLGATLDATQALRRRGVRLFPVGGSGVDQEAQFVFRAMSFLTMGQYLFLTDHSGIGNLHATPDVPEFQVERLHRLMIRMISSELAGKRLAPQEVIAIERGDLEPSVPPVLEANQGQNENAGQNEGQAVPQDGAAAASSSFSLPSLASSPLAWVALAMVICCVFACDAIRDRVRSRE